MDSDYQLPIINSITPYERIHLFLTFLGLMGNLSPHPQAIKAHLLKHAKTKTSEAFFVKNIELPKNQDLPISQSRSPRTINAMTFSKERTSRFKASLKGSFIDSSMCGNLTAKPATRQIADLMDQSYALKKEISALKKERDELFNMFSRLKNEVFFIRVIFLIV